MDFKDIVERLNSSEEFEEQEKRMMIQGIKMFESEMTDTLYTQLKMKGSKTKKRDEVTSLLIEVTERKTNKLMNKYLRGGRSFFDLVTTLAAMNELVEIAKDNDKDARILLKVLNATTERTIVELPSIKVNLEDNDDKPDLERGD